MFTIDTIKKRIQRKRDLFINVLNEAIGSRNKLMLDKYFYSLFIVHCPLFTLNQPLLLRQRQRLHLAVYVKFAVNIHHMLFCSIGADL